MLDGRTALVTGAASGLGRAIALAFADAGARVVLLDRDERSLAAVAEELDRSPPEHLVRTLDVSDGAAVSHLFRQLEEHLGSAEVLVNCAGVREVAGPLELSDEEWNSVISINLGGTFYCCREMARSLMRDGGSIINLSSIAGMVGFGRRSAYGASKAGILGLTRSLAHDLAPAIRVNAICPGLVRTPMIEHYFADEELIASLLATVPLGVAGEPEDIAQAALFLASDMSRLITGISLPVDGGFLTVRAFDPPGADSGSGSEGAAADR